MRKYREEYNDRVEEVKLYFEFVSKIDKIETFKKEEIDLIEEKHIVTRDLQKILRSNCFILLYNLIESTIRNGINEIFDEIHDNNLNIEDISDKIKDIWLTKKSNDLLSINSLKNFKKSIQLLIDGITNGIDIEFNSEHMRISGNMDYRSIRELSNKYGFHGRISNTDKEKLGGITVEVKNKRNYLAHGNQSFKKASELTTINDLNNYKDEIFIFLSDICDNLDRYLDNKKYKKTP